MRDSFSVQGGNYSIQPLDIYIDTSKTNSCKLRAGKKTVTYKRLAFSVNGIRYKCINGNFPDKKIINIIKCFLIEN